MNGLALRSSSTPKISRVIIGREAKGSHAPQQPFQTISYQSQMSLFLIFINVLLF